MSVVYKEISEKLIYGKSASSMIYAIYENGQIIRAEKRVDLSQSKKEHIASIENEASVMGVLLSDENRVSRLLKFQKTETEYILQMEYFGGGDMFDHLMKHGALSEEKTKAVIKSVLETVGWIHSKGVTHRDLKLENLMFSTANDYNSIHVIDFGFASQENQMVGKIGTVGYLSPEMLEGYVYGNKVDVWNIGVIMFILLTKRNCFDSANHGGLNFNATMLKHAQRSHELCDRFLSRMYPEANVFLKKLLHPNPRLRYSVAEALQDPWITCEKKPTRSKFATKVNMLYASTVIIIVIGYTMLFNLVMSRL